MPTLFLRHRTGRGKGAVRWGVRVLFDPGLGGEFPNVALKTEELKFQQIAIKFWGIFFCVFATTNLLASCHDKGKPLDEWLFPMGEAMTAIRRRWDEL